MDPIDRSQRLTSWNEVVKKKLAPGRPVNPGKSLSLEPLILSAASLAEGAVQGTTVGSLAGAATGSSLSLINNAGGRFQLSGSTVEAGPTATDYETSKTYSIRVRETNLDAKNSPLDTVFTIAITDIAEQPALSELSGLFSLSEDAPKGTLAGTLEGMTPGSTISLLDDAGGRVALDLPYVVRGTTGLDFESSQTHSFTVRESLADAPNSPRDTVFTLTVDDVYEIAELEELSGIFELPENAIEDGVAGEIRGAAEGSILSLVDDAGGRLKLVGTAIVAGSTPFDFEVDSTHEFTVRETLEGAPNSPRDTVLSLKVTDIADGPALNELSGNFELTEGAESGVLAGELAGITPGSTLALIDDAAGRVALEGRSIVCGSVATDYQSASVHQFVVRETLNGSPNSPRDTVLTLDVLDTADEPALTTLFGTFELSENAAHGDAAGEISGATSGSTLTLLDDAGGRLQIDGRTIVAGAGELDFETASSHTFVVRETLEGATNSPNDTTLMLSVTNALEQPALESLTGDFVLPETAEQGAIAGTLGGITPGSTLAILDSAGDRVELALPHIVRGPATLDFESAVSNTFIVRETLADAPNSPRDTTFTLTVTDVAEIPGLTALTANFSLTEGAEQGTSAGKLQNKTPGSLLSLTDDAGGRVQLNGVAIEAGPAATNDEAGASHTFVIRETLEGSENSPLDSVLTLEIKESISTAKQTTFSRNRFAPISMTFAEPLEYGTWPDGEQYVVAPEGATLVSDSPPSMMTNGQYTNGTTYSNEMVNGLHLNPGNRVYAPGGSKEKNQGNQPTGYHTITPVVGGAPGVTASKSNNSSPTFTGTPLIVRPGDTLVKAVCKDPYPGTGRPGLIDKMYLDVLASHPTPGTLRYGTASTDNTHNINESDWDLTVFRNIPKIPDLKPFETLLQYVDKDFGLEFTDFVNRENALAHNQSYTWDVSTELTYVTTALHFAYTKEQKITLLNKLWANIAADYIERIREGGACQVPYGGQDSFAKYIVAMLAAALHDASDRFKLNEIRDLLNVNKNLISSIDMMHPVNGFTPEMIIAPMVNSTLERPADEIKWWMMEAVDYIQNPTITNYGVGSNWDSQYRDNVDMAGMSHAIACYLTRGAWELFERPDAFDTYFKTFRQQCERVGRYDTGQVRNFVEPDRAAILEALWRNGYSSNQAPKPIIGYARADLGEGTSTIWVRFDRALDELTAVSASNYRVRVNGTEVSDLRIAPPPTPSPRLGLDSSGRPRTAGGFHVPPEGWVPYGIFRTNIGLILPYEVTPDDTITVEYLGNSTPKLRSFVDNVSVIPFSPITLQNITPTSPQNSGSGFASANSRFPVVLFDGSTNIGYKGDVKLGQDSPTGTLFLKNLKWFNTPSGTNLIYPFSGDALEVSINSANCVTISLRRNGVLLSRIRTGSLSKGLTHDLTISWDQRDSSPTSGVSLFVDGKLQAPNSHLWRGDASFTTTYSNASSYRFARSAWGVKMAMELGAFWFMPGIRIPTSEFGKFTADQIGPFGEGITGTRPPLFMVGNADQWNSRFGINRGQLLPMFKQTESGVTDVSGSAWLP